MEELGNTFNTKCTDFKNTKVNLIKDVFIAQKNENLNKIFCKKIIFLQTII